MKKLLTLILLFTVCEMHAQSVDTVAVHSQSMNKNIKNVVVLPASYGKDPAKKYPVVYLLHGYGGRYDTWIVKSQPNLQSIATTFDVIAVCPDGANSWYFDSPIDPSMRYDTYVSKELVKYVDSHYRTIAVPEGRAVTGFSMGGHGGLWLGFTHQDVYGACGSLSGGVDFRPWPERWELKKALGDYAANRRVWDEHTVIEQVYRLSPGRQAIIVACGTEDFFFDINQELHRKLLYHNIPHDYIAQPGEHKHPIWAGALDYQMVYFRKYFDSKK